MSRTASRKGRLIAAALLAWAGTASANATGAAARKVSGAAKDLDVEHHKDGLGLVLFLLSLATAASLFLRWDTTLGRFINGVVPSFFGLVSVVVPFGLAILSWRVWRHPEQERQTSRIVLGWTVLFLSILVLLGIINGSPSPGAGVSDAGGFIGWAGGWVFVSLVGAWAAIGFVVAAFLGVTIIAGVPLRTLTAHARTLRAKLRGRGTPPAGGDAGEVVEGVVMPPDPPTVPETPLVTVPPAAQGAAPPPDLPQAPLPAGEQLPLPADRDEPAAPVYKLPDAGELLVAGEDTPESTRETDQVIEAINQFFAHGVHPPIPVMVRHGGYTRGPTLTLYELTPRVVDGKPAPVKSRAVKSTEQDLSRALEGRALRILETVPGKTCIGIEVENRDRDTVRLGKLLASPAVEVEGHPLAFPLGPDSLGNILVGNFAKFPHVLVCGETGSGKSEFLNMTLTAVAIGATPEQVRMVLIDPKRVELSHFAKLPHLLTPIITSHRKGVEALQWVEREMEIRYELLASTGYSHIDDYNAAVRRGKVIGDDGQPLDTEPYILVVADELAALMMIDVPLLSVEDLIVNLAQLARAAGIHLVLATQRPSVNVVTGTIKANIPTRVAFAVSSNADSRVILDKVGAEDLLGKGDGLYLGPDTARPVRFQSALVTKPEIAKVVAHCQAQANGQFTQEGALLLDGAASGEDTKPAGDIGDDWDLFCQAAEMVVATQFGSTSMLQRKLRVGFAKAGRLMDLLESRGVVGPSKGAKARDVLIKPDELAEALDKVRQPAASPAVDVEIECGRCGHVMHGQYSACPECDQPPAPPVGSDDDREIPGE